MCDHCGCQSFPLVKRLTEEHFVIHDAIGALVRAVRTGAPDATGLLEDLLRLLEPHVAYEERSLMRELDGVADFAELIASLRAERDEVHGVLTRALSDGIEPPVVLPALERLYANIDKEEYGLFPAAVVLMDLDAWERATQVS